MTSTTAAMAMSVVGDHFGSCGVTAAGARFMGAGVTTAGVGVGRGGAVRDTTREGGIGVAGRSGAGISAVLLAGGGGDPGVAFGAVIGGDGAAFGVGILGIMPASAAL